MPPTKLRAWRESKGYTLEDVSGLTGVSVPMLSKVETGHRQLAPDTKVRLAHRLGVQVRELFEVEDLADAAS